MELRNHTYYKLFLYSIFTIVLSRVGILFVLCVIPLHFMFREYPGRAGFLATAVITAGLFLWDIIGYLGMGARQDELLLVAVAVFYPTVLFIGIIVYYLRLPFRRLFRFGLSGIVPAVIGFILVAVVNGDGAAAEKCRDFYYAIYSELLSYSGIAVEVNSVDFLFTLAFEIVKCTFLPIWCLVFGFGLFLSEVLTRRRISPGISAEPVFAVRKNLFIEGFRVPVSLLWPFIGSWMLVLADIVLGLGTLGDIIWNIALSLLLVYGTAGLSIIIHWAGKRRSGNTNPLSWVFLIIFLLFIPGVNAIIFIGVPVLGLSEYWIHYRKNAKENEDESNIE